MTDVIRPAFGQGYPRLRGKGHRAEVKELRLVPAGIRDEIQALREELREMVRFASDEAQRAEEAIRDIDEEMDQEVWTEGPKSPALTELRREMREARKMRKSADELYWDAWRTLQQSTEMMTAKRLGKKIQMRNQRVD